MQKTTRSARRAADAMRHKIYPSNGMRAAWIAGPNGEPIFAMVPHSTPSARMAPEWARNAYLFAPSHTDSGAYANRFQRRDWRNRRAEERHFCRHARAKRHVTAR